MKIADLNRIVPMVIISPDGAGVDGLAIAMGTTKCSRSGALRPEVSSLAWYESRDTRRMSSDRVNATASAS